MPGCRLPAPCSCSPTTSPRCCAPSRTSTCSGPSDPWALPPDWLESTQQRLKALAEDPRGQGGVAPSGSWKTGHVGRGAVPVEPGHLPAQRDTGLGRELRQPGRPAAQAVAVRHLHTDRATDHLLRQQRRHLAPRPVVAPARPRRRGPHQGARADARVRRGLRRRASVRAARSDVHHDAAPGARRPGAAQAPRRGGLGRHRQDLARAGLHRGGRAGLLRGSRLDLPAGLVAEWPRRGPPGAQPGGQPGRSTSTR